MKQIILALLLAGGLAAAQYDLDPAKTEIAFVVTSTLHTVHGTFQLKRGSIRIDSGTGKAAGEIAIDVASGESGSGSRDKRMQKEILESQKYPEAVFTPDRVQGQVGEHSEVELHGMFKIHGGEHELTLHVKVEGHQASTHFSIPYVEWGMKDPSNFLLKVGKTVEVEVKTNLGRE